MQSVKKMIENDILLQEKLIERYDWALLELPEGYLTIRKRADGADYFVNTSL